jgi:hypothetical protein
MHTTILDRLVSPPVHRRFYYDSQSVHPTHPHRLDEHSTAGQCSGLMYLLFSVFPRMNDDDDIHHHSIVPWSLQWSVAVDFLKAQQEPAPERHNGETLLLTVLRKYI